MFEKYLEKLIKQKLGAFLEGVDENKLNFGMSEANLSLNNVKLRQDALLKLKMPINIELGEIRQLYIRVPWLKIGSSPVEISVTGLNIIVSPQNKTNWVFQDIFVREYLEQMFMGILNKVEAEMSAGDENQGYFSKLAMKVLDNISVSIKDIHFRFEDHFSTLDQSYSFGLVLKRLEIQTTNENWEPQYVDRSDKGRSQNLFKMVEIEGLGFYLNPEEKHIIYQQTQNKEMRIQLMEALMMKEEKREILQYLLRPMSLQLKVEQINASEGKKININVELEKFHISFLRSQLRCLIKFMELVSEFQAMQAQQQTFFVKSTYFRIKTKKFRFLRPITHRVTSQNAKDWWKYACQCINRSNKAKNGSMREFVIPMQTLVIQQVWFGKFLSQYCIKKEGNYQLLLSLDDTPMFNHIMSSVDPTVIKKWIKAWFDGNQKKKDSKEKSKGFTSWLFGGGQKEKRQSIMSDQEAEAIEKEIQSSVLDVASANSLTVGVQVLFKEAIFDAGITNEQGIIEGIRLYSQDIKASFVQLKNSSSPDLTFDLTSSIRDFGVDLYQFDPNLSQYTIQDSIIISNKKINKFGGSEQWKIRVRKRPEDNKAVEFDIELSVNPFLLMYQKEFVNRAILISKVKINQQAQNAAIDKIEDIREATSNSIYQLLYKKANRLRVNIASPVIVLPLTADKNPTSPLWVLRLGDLKIESQEPEIQTTSIMEYERYHLVLDSVRLKYYQTFEYWDKIVSRVYSLRELTGTKVEEKNDIVFSVIEDCSMQLDVAIKQKKGGGLLMMTADQRNEYQKKPKVQIKGTSSDIKINLSHSIFNKLVNLGDIFDTSSIKNIEQPREQEQIESKQQMLNKAKKVGQVQKRLDPLNQWENYFCILSDSHLYFYKDAKQVMPAANFYFKAASIVENSPDLSVKNTILLKNRFGECIISLKNEVDMKDWTTKIKTALYELQMAEEEAQLAIQLQSIEDNQKKQEEKIKKKKKKINHVAVVSSFEFKVPLFKTLLVDELKQHSDWIIFNFNELSLNNCKLKSSSNLELRVKSITLVDLTMPINSSLIGKKQFRINSVDQDALQVFMHSLEKYNPEYLGIDSIIDIKMNNLFVKMQPNSINEVIKFVRNTKPGCSFNLMEKDKEEEKDFDHDKIVPQMANSASEIQNSMVQSVISSRHQPQNQNVVSCQTIREIKSQYNVSISNLSLSFLHQDYNMEIYRLDSSLLEIQYNMHYDHMVFIVKFKDAAIFDLTGYPYTINPKYYAENPANFYQTQREMTSMKPSNSEDYALDLRFEGYQPTCALKKKGYSSKINLSIKPIQVEFFNESFMRFFSYFFEQFLNAVILTDPYNNPELEELEKLKRRKTLRKDTIKKLVDFQQQTEIIEMDIKINEFAINIPDRPQSRNQMSLTFKEFRVSQHIKLKPGRVLHNKEKELWAKSFRMDVEKAMIVYGGDTVLTEEPFNMSIIFENLAFSPIFAKLDPKLVDQATYLRIKFDPVLLTIKQKVYTMILRILDLNINYTDFLEREYYFLKFVLMEEYFKSLEQIVGMRIKIDFKCLALRLEHVDNTFVSELMLLNFVMKMTKYRDLKNLMEVDIQNFFLLDQPQPEKLYKKNMNELLKLISAEDCVIQPKSIRAAMTQPSKEFFNKTDKNLTKQVTVCMKMEPNGEKDMKIDIKSLRISIKPHVLLMIQNFFLNSFPEYDQMTIDKPSTINFDPEKAAKMEIKILTQECLLVFQNRPGLKTLACHGDITFELGKQNIKEIKKLLEENKRIIIEEMPIDPERPKIPKNRKNTENSQFNDAASIDDAPQIDRKQMMMAPSKVNSDIAYYMLVKIEKFCPFVCSLSQLNEYKSFAKIKKRQLMNDFSFSYNYKGHIVKIKSIDQNAIGEFGANILSQIDFSKIKAKISIQDMILMNQIVDFANYNIINEYQKKLDIINQINKNLNNSKISDVKIKQTQIQHNQDSMQQFRISEEGNDEDEDILDSLNHQYQKNFTSEIQRLRSTTRALSSIAQKLTVVENKSKGPKVKKPRNRQSRRDRTIIDDKNQDNNQLLIETKNQRKTHISRLQDNPNQLGVFFSATNAANQGAGTVVGTILDNNQRKTIIEEEEVKRDTIFYSAKDPKETYINDEQFLSPNEFPDEDTDVQVNGVLTQQEKMRRAIKVEQIKFDNALENVISNRQTIKSEGFQIIFINDYDDVFCPVIDIDIPEAEMESVTQKGTSEMKAMLPKMRVNYFNPHIGDQEPFIESFSVVYTYVESESALHSKQIFTNIEFPTPIWINLTDQCFENIIETYYSWMESPAYQYDDFKKIQKKNSVAKLPVNPPQIKSAIASVNDNQAEKAVGAASGVINQNKNKSKSESINDDKEDLDDMLYGYENNSIIERVVESEEKVLNADNFNKVSPYSIRNLSSYPMKVFKSQRAGHSEDFTDNNTLHDSIFQRFKNEQSMVQLPDVLDVEPNHTVQYTVDLDNDQYDVLYNLNKKSPNPLSTKTDSPFKQRERLYSTRTNQDLKKINKNQELVSLVFETFEDIKGIDLNKIDQQQVDLIPRGSGEILNLDGASSPRRGNGSTVVTEEDSSLRMSSKSNGGEPKKKKKGDKYVVTRNFEKLIYGVILKKMRKTLTIRQEYVLSNNTMYNFVIKITHQFEKTVSKQYCVKAESQFGINSSHYQNYSISFKVDKRIDLMTDEPIKFEEESKQLILDGFSEPVLIEDLVKLNLDQGMVVQHDGMLYTYLRKQKGEIGKTFDIVMLPPVSIKNCLPCELELMSAIGEGQGFLSEESKSGGQIFQFEKQDEKQLHIINYLGANKDEIFLRFRVSGFIWGISQFKRKNLGIYADEDIDIKIKDKDSTTNSIGVKLLQKKAGFQLIFYAHTVILNQSNLLLGYHLNNSLNKQVIGGQHSKHDMCIFSKEDSFLASISNRYSSGIQIKNIGLTEYFSIQTSDTSVSVTQDDESKPFNRTGNERTLLRSSQASVHEKRFDFVYQTYLSLVSDQESVYTKIVQIAPRYIAINKSPLRFCLAQVGNEALYDNLDSGERREWYWADSSNDHKLVVKLDDEDDSRWLWSSPIDIKETGTDAITLLQNQKRFNKKEMSFIIKLTKKIIDGTMYIILEEEDDVHPQYRIENLTDDIAVWYVQKDIALLLDGKQLLPMSITPFAFQDFTIEKPSLQIYLTKTLAPKTNDIDFNTDGTIVRFNDFNFEQTLSLHNSQKPGEFYQVKISSCTDGYSKIVRISDRPTAEQEDRALQNIKLAALQAKNPKENEHEQEQLKSPEDKKPKGNVTNILKFSVNEILVSFVSKITERVQNDEMVSNRKEIALLTIQDISFERLQSSEQNIENNKLQIMKIQLDNMSSVNPLFPTVIQPMIYRNKETKPMIDFELDLRLENPDLTYIENLDFKLSGIVVKLDDRFLGYCVTFVMELQEKTKTNFTGLHPIFKRQAVNPRVSFAQNKNLIAEGNQVFQFQRKDSQYHGYAGNDSHEGVLSVHYVSNSKHQQAMLADTNRISNRSSVRSSRSSSVSISGLDDAKDDENEQYKSWKTKKIDNLNKRIFIKDCKMSSVKIEISFLVRKSVKKLGGKSQQSELNKMLDNWGLAVFNIDQVPVKVRPFEQLQLFGTQDTIMALISDHFINNIKRNILKLLFSFAIFGNPRKLVASISKGLYDFKTMPMQGDGVGGFIVGSAKGTVSLLKNTFEGTFGVVESFTGGFSKLALVFNQDEDYLGTREEKIITEKPRNLVEGVGFGCQTAIGSILAAGYGLFSRPIIEARRNGFRGFFQGLYSGTTGLVLKPLSGGLDLVSKSAEGIKNTVKIFEAQIFNDRRRYPRVFYGNQEMIKPYNEMDSYIQCRILNSIDDPNQFKNDRYLEAIPYTDNQRTMLLVLSEEHLLLLDAAQKSLKWFINSSQISDIEKFKNGLIINLTKKQDGKDKVAIEITNTNVLQNVYDKIQHLQQLEYTD